MSKDKTQQNQGLTDLAVKVLRETLQSTRAPASTKVQAAKLLLEMEHKLGPKSTGPAFNTKDAETMSLSDLDKELAELEAKLLENNVNPVTGERLH